MLRRAVALAGAALLVLTACGNGDARSSDSLIVYSGRTENLVKPLLVKFQLSTGVKIEIRYSGSSDLAAQILEEGDNRKVDVFLSQDAGALGALAKEGVLDPIAQADLAKVDPKYRAKDGSWVGLSGRVRSVVYNPDLVAAKDLPKSVWDFADPKWQGKIAYAPTNASFQAFVTGMRVTAGEDRTRQWLTALKSNGKPYDTNIQIRDAVDNGQIALGLTNHYYLYEKIAEVGAGNVKARNYFFPDGDIGSLVNVAGVGIIKGTKKRAEADRLVAYLLSPDSQKYFAEQTAEFPLVAGVETVKGLPTLDDVESPDVDLSDLDSLKQTLDLLAQVGLT